MQDEIIYDAIVIGSGISGGWAAKELCEKGLKTLVLERGRDVRHIQDYDSANTPIWEMDHRGQKTQKQKADAPIQSSVYAFNEGTKQYWVKDKEYPYQSTADGPAYKWIRGYHKGGRSIMWGRQTYRWSDYDFNANKRDGWEIDWPVRYDEIAPWYSYVERFAGISGEALGLPQLPDSEFLPPMELNCVEDHVKQLLAEKYNDRKLTIGRVANLTKPHNGRGQCQRRNLCYRGCPYGAYFSSQSATLPAAERTGNMTLQADSIVDKILFDKETRKATGVHVVDANTGVESVYKAKIIFLCASTLNSTWLLLNSSTDEYANGLGNSSDVLGRYLMDHHYQMGAHGTFEGFDDKYYFGGRPNGIYLPRFRNLDERHPDFIRGYGYQGGAARSGWNRGAGEAGFGEDFKDGLTKPGPWRMTFHAFGEVLPYKDNRATLNHDIKDKHGMPTLDINVTHRENERKMRKDAIKQAGEMLDAAGAKDISPWDGTDHPGFGIHEMGSARMGNDPKNSFVNKWNQAHDIQNLFITDGSFMTSASCVNPSLTYMAFTARAVDYAVKELNKQNL